MSEAMTQRIIRAMAWQRAKGELYSILETYTSGHSGGNARKAQHSDMARAIDSFVALVESEGLVE